MCGRFTLTTADYDAVARALGAIPVPEFAQTYRPRFNVAPSDVHWALCHDDRARRVLLPAQWGMPPPRRRGQSPPPTEGFINARAETAADKWAFRGPFLRARCAIPADGFFEWTGPKADRRPIWFHAVDRAMFVFAGLYRDVPVPGTDRAIRRFTLLTTESNATVEPYHHRMPVILRPEAIDPWLQAPPQSHADRNAFTAALHALLGPAPATLLRARPVSRRVNRPEHDDPACLAPVPEQTDLLDPGRDDPEAT